jgi:ubiquitin-specific protease-like protein
MEMYYVRVLNMNGNKAFVQWIDNSKDWAEHVHPHMITEYKEWKNTHKGTERPPIPMRELTKMQKDIPKTTVICTEDDSEHKDSLRTPMIKDDTVGIWCDRCKKWYSNNCLTQDHIDLTQSDLSEYLPCFKIHFPDDIKTEETKATHPIRKSRSKSSGHRKKSVKKTSKPRESSPILEYPETKIKSKPRDSSPILEYPETKIKSKSKSKPRDSSPILEYPESLMSTPPKTRNKSKSKKSEVEIKVEEPEQSNTELEKSLKKLRDKFLIDLKKEKNDIKKEELQGLITISKPGVWLNETIINSLAEQLKNNNVYIINSLQTVLIVNERKSVQRMKEKEMLKMKANKHPIKTIIIPYCIHNHWIGFLIDFHNPKEMNIWCFDSFGGKNVFPKQLLDYVVSLLDLNLDSMKVNIHTFPIKHLQNDGHSCGVYLARWLQQLQNNKNLDPTKVEYVHTVNPNQGRLELIHSFMKK